MAAKNKAGISVFQKYLSVWVILCMVVGVLIGRLEDQASALIWCFLAKILDFS